MKILLIGPANGPCTRLAGILGERGCHVVQVATWTGVGEASAASLERLLRAHGFRASVRFNACADGRAAVRPDDRPAELLSRHRIRQFVASPAPEARLRFAAGRMLDELRAPAQSAARVSCFPYSLLAA